MYIPFENLPLESKIWVYQSNRKFTDDEFSEIEIYNLSTLSLAVNALFTGVYRRLQAFTGDSKYTPLHIETAVEAQH